MTNTEALRIVVEIAERNALQSDIQPTTTLWKEALKQQEALTLMRSQRVHDLLAEN